MPTVSLKDSLNPFSRFDYGLLAGVLGVLREDSGLVATLSAIHANAWRFNAFID
jgi:hypothetical protein